MDTDGRVRLGLIGTGRATERLHWPALRQMPDRYEIVAFADPDRTNASRFARLAGVSMDAYTADHRRLLERAEVEAVLVSVPIPLLYPMAREALEAGKHVLCEKPPGVDEAQGRSFLAAAEAHRDRTLLIAENVFYRDDVRLARQLLEGGAIGRVHLMAMWTVSRNVPIPGRFSETPWRQHAEYRGGAQLDAGVHDIAQIRVLCGEAAGVSGAVQWANRTIDGPSDLNLGLRFTDGAIGSYVASYTEIPVPAERNEMRLYGIEGTMVVGRGPEGREVAVHGPDGSVELHQFAGSDGGYYGEFRNFHEALVHGEPVVGDVEQSFRNLLIIQRALDAAERAAVLPVDGSGDGRSAPGVPLWRPHGAADLFDGLPVRHTVTHLRAAGDPGFADHLWSRRNNGGNR